jgi:integrase/recombinase XerD
MTALRRRMTEGLQLRGYADPTIEAYVFAIAQVAMFYGTAPDQLTEEQLRDNLLHLTTVRKIAASSFTQALCALKFFYEQTLKRQWTLLDLARPSARSDSRSS